MRTKREDAPAKVRNFYKNAKSLIDMSNGEIKPGMLPMVLRMVGGISRAKEEDLEAVNNMTEEEWMEYALPKFFPGYFGPKEESTKALPASIDYTAKLDEIKECLVNLGAMDIRICGKLDRLIELQSELLAYWKGGEQ
ncbi:MAG: hypothetical protein K5893_12740 [Prevotella sp.]|nr:hypothetical protein [Prevotella sp.]